MAVHLCSLRATKDSGRQTKQLRHFLPSEERPICQNNDTKMGCWRQFYDSWSTVGELASCQKTNGVNVLDFSPILAMILLNKDSILSSRESIAVDFSVASASCAERRLLSLIKIRYSRIRFATISI